MQHVMIDLETLGTSADAVILSVGAVKFDLSSDQIDDMGFYSVIDIDDSLRAGRTIMSGTLAWWMKQSAEAQGVFHDAAKLPLEDVLLDLAAWLADKEYIVWSNGADFDLPMLAHAYIQEGMTVPWKYSNTRCFRTFKNLPGMNKAKLPANVSAHNALADAVWQAQALQAYNSILVSRK